MPAKFFTQIYSTNDSRATSNIKRLTSHVLRPQKPFANNKSLLLKKIPKKFLFQIIKPIFACMTGLTPKVKQVVLSAPRCTYCFNERNKLNEYERLMMCLKMPREELDFRLSHDNQTPLRELEHKTYNCIMCGGRGVVYHYAIQHTRGLIIEKDNIHTNLRPGIDVNLMF